MAFLPHDRGPSVIAVARSSGHHFSKPVTDVIQLLAGLGVEGDAHFGATVKHRHTMQKNPQAPNRRQVHLIDMERLEEFAQHGFDVKPGEMGENVTVRGVNLLDLPQGTLDLLILKTLSLEQQRRAIKVKASVLTTDPYEEGCQVLPNVNTLTRNAAKIAYEKYFMRKMKTGNTDPVYEKYVLKALGIVRLAE